MSPAGSSNDAQPTSAGEGGDSNSGNGGSSTNNISIDGKSGSARANGLSEGAVLGLAIGIPVGVVGLLAGLA